MLQLLLFSALAFTFLMKTGLYPPELRSTVLDSDWLYRRFLPRIRDGLGEGYTMVVNSALASFHARRRALLGRVARIHQPFGAFGEPWPTGTTTLWAAIMLFTYLVLYF